MQIVSIEDKLQIETICMRCQILFSGQDKKKKYFKRSSAENFTQSAKRY